MVGLNSALYYLRGISVQKKVNVILTGGDAKILSKTLKITIFANQIFILEGLNSILNLNKQ